MMLHPPFMISPRLLPALRLSGAWVQVEYAELDGAEGRTRYRWTIDIDGVDGPDGGGFSGDDLQSGRGGGNLLDGFRSLLTFLGACGESVNWGRRTSGRAEDGEHADLFPVAVAEWAAENEDELTLLHCQLEEDDDLIEEGRA